MRALEKPLRRLETGLLLPPVESAESCRILDAVLDEEHRRATRLGLPVQDGDPEPLYRSRHVDRR